MPRGGRASRIIRRRPQPVGGGPVIAPASPSITIPTSEYEALRGLAVAAEEFYDSYRHAYHERDLEEPAQALRTAFERLGINL